MRKGILSVLDIPEIIEGHALGVNIREEVLGIAEELIRQSERGCISSRYFNPHQYNLQPTFWFMRNLNPGYYNRIIEVYETILKMSDEIMGKRSTSQVCEMEEEFRSEINKAQRYKKELLDSIKRKEFFDKNYQHIHI